MLAHMAETVFGANPCVAGTATRRHRFYEGKPQDIFRRNGQYVLSLSLPLVARDEIETEPQRRRRTGDPHRQLEAQRLAADGAGAPGHQRRKIGKIRLNIFFDATDTRGSGRRARSKRWENLKSRLARERFR